jgi:hypothetical protein
MTDAFDKHDPIAASSMDTPDEGFTDIRWRVSERLGLD